MNATGMNATGFPRRPLASGHSGSRHGLSRYLVLFTIFILLPAGDLLGQRITYEYLRVRDRQPSVFFEHHVLPDRVGGGMQLATTFRLENNFLSFRREREGDEETQQRRFFAEPSVQVNIRKHSEASQSEAVEEQMEEQAPITRTWSETAYAGTYEQTQSSTLFLQHLLTTSMETGHYRIEAIARSDGRTRRALTPSLRIPGDQASDRAFFYFLDEASTLEPPFTAPLVNMGGNAYFGRDHQLVIWLPDPQPDAVYSMEIHKVRINRRDTTSRDRVMEHILDTDKLTSGYLHRISMVEDRPNFFLEAADTTFQIGSYYFLTIPNSRFENAHFRLQLTMTPANGEPVTIARRIYQSLWLDMPVSLLNLDVAIEMMRFIMDDEQHRSLRRGDRREREERFHQFWAGRDPSPAREYNELMVEYFRRIDYAYEHFTTPQIPGYESDQGQIYIRHGEPDRRERTFPPGQPAREVWYYGERSFVFEATSGFGDYRLIERR